MTYFRAMGDPITSPSQVDDGIFAGEVPPTRVECNILPANSPWRQPGQICADAPGGGILSYLWETLKTSVAEHAPPVMSPPIYAPPPSDDHTGLLLLGAAGLGAAYLLFRKKRRT